jgi:hypothetical protein
MAINTQSTDVGALKDNYQYADFVVVNADKTIVQSPGVYVASLFLGDNLGIKSAVLAKSSSTASNADRLIISYTDPTDSTKFLSSVWSAGALNSTTGSITFTYLSGDTKYKGDISLLANFNIAKEFIGVYLPIDQSGAVLLTPTVSNAGSDQTSSPIDTIPTTLGAEKTGYVYSGHNLPCQLNCAKWRWCHFDGIGQEHVEYQA